MSIIVLTSYISWLIFCLIILSIIKCEVLKSPTIIVEWSCPLQFCQFVLHVFRSTLVRYKHVYNCSILLIRWHCFHYKYPSLPLVTLLIIMFTLILVQPHQLSFDYYLWYMFPHPFTFNWFVALNPKYVYCRQHVVEYSIF